MRLLERMGASAVQLEDQTLPKRCGHLSGKTLVPVAEMTGKLHAALDARLDDDMLIIARTDAVAVEGLEAGIERAAAYIEAGADVLFVGPWRAANSWPGSANCSDGSCHCWPIWSKVEERYR